MNFIVVARLKAKPGREVQLEDACRGMVANMRREPNNLDVMLHHSLDEPATYTFYAVYTDRAAWDYHRATPHGASFATQLEGILDSHSVELWEQIDRR
jgi:quinol monooxygenase YgiN